MTPSRILALYDLADRILLDLAIALFWSAIPAAIVAALIGWRN